MPFEAFLYPFQLLAIKGATVLVSSQSAAWEASGSGLLTFALAEEGLGRRMAAGPDGRITLVGALAYAAARVPGLFVERIDRGGDVQQPMPDVQQPMLYDFRSAKVDVLLTGLN